MRSRPPLQRSSPDPALKPQTGVWRWGAQVRTAPKLSVQAAILNLLHEQRSQKLCITHNLAVVEFVVGQIVVVNAALLNEAPPTECALGVPMLSCTNNLLEAVLRMAYCILRMANGEWRVASGEFRMTIATHSGAAQ